VDSKISINCELFETGALNKFLYIFQALQSKKKRIIIKPYLLICKTLKYNLVSGEVDPWTVGLMLIGWIQLAKVISDWLASQSLCCDRH
jgi:hypothetical protein